MSPTISRRAATSGFHFAVSHPSSSDPGVPRWRRFVVAIGDRARQGVPGLLCLACLLTLAVTAIAADDLGPGQVIHRLQSHNETLELTVNTSRIVTIGKELPRVIVNNPEIAEVTALSPTHIQVMAKKPGVTQVNLFSSSEAGEAGKEDEIHTLDLIVYPDARELTMLLRTQFPTAALKVVPTANSVILSGYVDDPNQVQRIVEIAGDYAPRVLNNIKVGGVQQVLLQCKVMEVSRTKVRNMGFDWGSIGGNGDFAVSGVGGLLNTMSGQSSSATQGAKTALGQLTTGSAQNFSFGVLNGGSAFFGVLNFLTQKNVAKVVSEPQLVTVSGRPASFMVGGSFPIIVASAFYQSVQWRQYGTRVDFVPIVLGNGAIRLEVRPSVSELDYAQGTSINGTTIPGVVVREVDTGAELRVGQTLALAGLVQQRVETQNRGLIGISELPLLGIPFRNMQDTYNEIETLIMVTPHLVDAMDPCETPPGGPGYATTVPDNCELYCNGYLEVPNLKGPNMLGPYPDPHGVFPPLSKEAWEEDGKAKDSGMMMGPPVKPARGPTPKEAQRTGGRQRDFVERPQPPALSNKAPGTTNAAPKTSTARKMNTAGFVRFEGKESSEPAKPTVKTGASRQKKTPGFIGPTGYDLR